MPFVAKNFEHLIGLSGLSEQLLRNHFKLYEGYVNSTNGLVEKLKTNRDAYELAELRRRFGWEFNGMRLHELYFGNMSRAPVKIGTNGSLSGSMAAHFGSVEDWQADFAAAAKARGVGWLALVLDPSSRALYDVWVNEHDTGLLAGCKILLVLDVFEHAFMPDYGLNRAGYIDSFMKAIDWKTVEGRL